MCGLEINLRDSEGWAPLLFQYVETYASVAVYVWVENFCPESNLQNSSSKKCQMCEIIIDEEMRYGK